jgi:hypothetical protein
VGKLFHYSNLLVQKWWFVHTGCFLKNYKKYITHDKLDITNSNLCNNDLTNAKPQPFSTGITIVKSVSPAVSFHPVFHEGVYLSDGIFKQFSN